MVYLKRVVAGVMTLLVASVLYFCVYYVFLIRPRLPKMPPGTGVGLDVRVFDLPFFSLIALLATTVAIARALAEMCLS